MTSFLSLLALAASAAAASTPEPKTSRGYVVEEEVVMSTEGQPTRRGTQRTEILPDRIRQESSNNPTVFLLHASGALPFIAYDSASRTWFGYERTTLVKADIPGGPLLEGIGIDDKGHPFAPAKPFRAMDTKSKVSRWTAHGYSATAKGAGGMETELWLADRPAGIPNDAMTSVLSRVYSHEGSRLEPYFAGLAALPGFPVRSVRRVVLPNGANAEIRSTVTKISVEDIPLSRFAVPAGFTRIPDPIGILQKGE